MRLDETEQDNVEDRRSEGGGGFGLPRIGGLGLGTVVILGLISWVLGIDPRLLIGGAEMVSNTRHPQTQGPARPTVKPSDDIGKFVSTVVGNINVEWAGIFAHDGKTYRKPVLVLYNQATRAACGGVAQSAMGPFYCPEDQKVYLDTAFFKDIETRFGGCEAGSRSCGFAQAYVIAHEIGHHVQNLLGILPKVQAQQQERDKASANRLQVQVELQADCFAGVWAKHENERLRREGKPLLVEPGDVEAAMQTASAIGDDTLQRRATGRVVPDSFTHGTSEQRRRWFSTGYREGTPAACNTFHAAT
jgi:hypothetical protein